MIARKKLAVALLTVAILVSLAGCTKTPPTPATDADILSARREQVVAYMRDMTSVLWRTDTAVTYTKHNYSLVPGRIYQGMPYTGGGGSAAALITYGVSQDANGVYNLEGLSEEDLIPRENGDRPRIGNDCADAVFWAWAQVSSTADFAATYRMTEAHGCIKVGEYEIKYTDETGDMLANTKQICKDNGEDVMYEAYAKLQPGDALTRTTGGNAENRSGHAILVSEVKVTRREDGTVNENLSYVKIIDQTNANLAKEKKVFNETIQEDVYLCGNIDKPNLFADLFKNGYLPMTCKELIDPADLADEEVQDSLTECSVENIFEGTFTSPYRISHVTITIADADGKVVQQSTCYGSETEMRAFDLSRFAAESEQATLRGILDLEALAAGTYRCTHTCHIAPGAEITVRDFEFTK